MNPSTDLAQSFDSLEIDSSNSANSIDPATSSPKAIAVDGQENIGFLSLPREVRDQIYLNLVVAEDPIQYNEKFESLSRSDTFANTAMKWMFDVESNPQIAQETRETFYQHNTFLIYTHDIRTLLYASVHTMSFWAGRGLETEMTYRTPFKAGAWVRNLAVRVGWHASGGWFTNLCCRNPADSLRVLLEQTSLRSIIIDARFGAWPYGVPEGIGWELLEEMKTKWGKEFRMYNDQRLEGDTRRYTSNRRDLSDILLPRSSRNSEVAETPSEKNEQDRASEHDEAEQLGYAETAAESEEEEREENVDESDDYWEQQEDYWEQHEAARINTSEERSEEGSEENEGGPWSGDELAQGAWSIGEKLIIQAGERLIKWASTGERWSAE